jgi:hypothetical protein
MCTPEMIAEIVYARSMGATIKDSCTYAGISEASYHDWKVRGEAGEEPFADFLEQITQARAKCVVKNLEIVKNAGKKDWRAAAHMLAILDPDNYAVGKMRRDAGDGVRHLNSQNDLQDALRELSDEQLAAISEAFDIDGSDDIEGAQRLN